MKMRINLCDKPIVENQNIKYKSKTSAELNVNVINAA